MALIIVITTINIPWTSHREITVNYPPFAVTVDIALFTIEDDTFKILLIERGGDPYRGDLALPGGFVLPDEGLDAAAARELEEETGLARGAWHLEQLAAYGDPARDPRMRTVTVAFWAITADLPRPRGGGDAAAAHLEPVDRIEGGDLRLAFDHDRIVQDAVNRIRSRLETTTIAAQFCPSAFTVAELRKVYETIWNTPLDPGNFQRFVRDSGAFTPVPSFKSIVRARAAPLARILEPPVDLPGPGEGTIDDAEAGPSADSEPPPDRLASGEKTVKRSRRGRPASRWMVREGRLARPLRRKTDDS